VIVADAAVGDDTAAAAVGDIDVVVAAAAAVAAVGDDTAAAAAVAAAVGDGTAAGGACLIGGCGSEAERPGPHLQLEDPQSGSLTGTVQAPVAVDRLLPALAAPQCTSSLVLIPLAQHAVGERVTVIETQIARRSR